MPSRNLLAPVRLALLLAITVCAKDDDTQADAGMSQKECTVSAGTRFLGHLSKTWMGNDADSYFPVFSQPPVFVNGTDDNFTTACGELCRGTGTCHRWSFWHARKDIGGVCFMFPPSATKAPVDWDYDGGYCKGDEEAARHIKHEAAVGVILPIGFLSAVATFLLAVVAASCCVRRQARRLLLSRDDTNSKSENCKSECSEAWDAELGLRCPSGNIDPLARQPTHWGMTVQQLALFYAIHENRLESYCRDHCLGSDMKHVCLTADCSHDHGAANCRARSASDTDESLSELMMTMHVVVDLVIKPFTSDDGGMLGYAPLLNKASPLKPTVFVSHCWSELFPDFVATLTNHLSPTTVVWICSFALPQNMDINALIGQGDLVRSPFAQALLQAQRLFLVTDERLLPLDRVWCLYEMYLSTENQIRIDVRAPTMSRGLFRNILQKVEVMDIRKCSAASVVDRDRIMSAVRGSEEKLNSEVRQSIEELVRLMESIKD